MLPKQSIRRAFQKQFSLPLAPPDGTQSPELFVGVGPSPAGGGTEGTGTPRQGQGHLGTSGAAPMLLQKAPFFNRSRRIIASP